MTTQEFAEMRADEIVRLAVTQAFDRLEEQLRGTLFDVALSNAINRWNAEEHPRPEHD